MRDLMGRLRPNVLVIALLLAAVCIADIANNGTATIGLAAAGGLAALATHIVDKDRRGE